MTFLSVLWFFLIFLLIAGYFVLDGFDLGAGILYPFFCKTEEEQAIVRRSIGPVWDGNEVWLLTAGGALFAAFPDAYATTFSGFYLAIMLVLFALIVRAVSFEFWAADTKWRPVWNVCFFIGSLLPALLFGVAVGNIIQGIPMDEFGNYTGVPLLGLITPFTLSCGILGLVLILSSGASWIAVKVPRESALYRRAKLFREWNCCVVLLFFVIASTIFLNFIDGENLGQPEMYVPRFLFGVIFLAGIVAARLFSLIDSNRGDVSAFISHSVALVALIFMVACTMFPNMVYASADSVGPAISIANSASSQTALSAMTVILCIGLPLVLVYHVIIYRTFRGRIKPSDLQH